MIARAVPTSPADPVVEAALMACASAWPPAGGCQPTIPTPGAGTALPEFLAAELSDCAAGAPEDERFASAAHRIDAAVETLAHVAAQLRARVLSSSSLPLPFERPVADSIPSRLAGLAA